MADDPQRPQLGTWLALVIWVVPAVAGLGLGGMVLVSARAQGFQDAYQLGSVVVAPVLLLGLFIWLLNGLLLWFGGRSFRRGRLLISSL